MDISLKFLLGLMALIAALFGAGGLEYLNRRPVVGALAIYLWIAILVLGTEHPEYLTRMVGGINVTLPDLLAVLLAAVGILRMVQGRATIRPGLKICLGVFVGLLLFSYLRGLREFGLQHATNEFREFFYFLSALAFAMSFPSESLAARLPQIAVVGGATLVAVALIRIPGMAGFGLEERAVPSYAALAIGQAFFLGWFWKRAQQPGLTRNLIFGFLPFALLMLHRSVWMALLAGVAALLVVDPRGRPRFLRTLLVGSALAAGLVAVFFREAVASGVDRAVSEATNSEQSTFLWRLEGWVALLNSDNEGSLVNWVAGKPMGSGYARVLGDSAVNAPEIEAGVIPHNYYLSTLLRSGIFGLIAFLALYIGLMRILYTQLTSGPEPALAAAFITILATQLVYYVPYSADIVQGLLLGGAISAAGVSREGLVE